MMDDNTPIDVSDMPPLVVPGEDAEVKAIMMCVFAIEGLLEPTQNRVLDYLNSRYGRTHD